jgi:general L-amino acid transport system permease protein
VIAARRPPPPRRLARGLLWQGLTVLALVAFLAWVAHNAAGALARRNMDLDWSFLLRPAGFDIPFRLTDWNTGDSYLAALGVAGLNTLLAAGLAIVGATLGGVVIALMRLGSNPLARAVARGYTELIRNTPQLLQIVFWYIVLLQALPPPRASMAPFPGVFLNVRGLLLPAPVSPWFAWVALASLAIMVLPGFVLPVGRRWMPRLAGLAVLAGGLATSAYSWPSLQGFNFTGGWRLPPELLALTMGIAIYTSAFLAENVRASIAAIPHGQTEAARSLGLSPSRTMRLVILPQALRTLLPPLTNHYVNIVKATTLGAAIAYPEILQIFARTVLNQSGRAVEVMTIVLGVYLVINLSVAAAMNGWDRRLRQQGR